MICEKPRVCVSYSTRDQTYTCIPLAPRLFDIKYIASFRPAKMDYFVGSCPTRVIVVKCHVRRRARGM